MCMFVMFPFCHVCLTGGCRVLGFCIGGEGFDYSIRGVMTIVALLALDLVFLGARCHTLLERSAS